MNIGIATLTTEVNLDGLDKGLDEAEGKTTSRMAGLGGNLAGLLAGGLAVGVAAVATGLLAIGAASVDVASQMKGAQNDFRAQLGASAEEAEALQQSVRNIYGDNFGDDIGDVSDSLIATQLQFRRLGDVSTEVIEAATTNALRLRDAYDIDVAESTNTAATLMEEFGLSQERAFDFIAHGMQNGLNASDDFLDSVGEYGGLFSDMGFTAGEFFSIMQTGQMGGMLGTDKVADAFKEFGIIVNEGGEEAAAAFDTLGLSYDDVAASVASGESTWSDFFPTILEGLQAIEDPLERNQLQVALFGTMAEDLGPSFIDGLSLSATALEDMAGATETLDSQYENLGSVMEGFKRRGLLALEPIGEILLDLANEAMPLVELAFQWFEETLVPMLETAADVAAEFLGAFKGGLEEGLTPLEAFRGAIEQTFGEEALAKFDDIYTKTTDFVENVRTGMLVVREHLDKARIGAKLVLDGWEAMTTGIAKFYNENVEPIVTALMGFGEWLAGQVFAIDFSLPELPEWMTTNSPLELHTRLMDFDRWLSSHPLKLNMGGMEAGTDMMAAVAGAGANGGGGGGQVFNIEVGDVVTAAPDGTALGLDLGGALRGAMRSSGMMT